MYIVYYVLPISLIRKLWHQATNVTVCAAGAAGASDAKVALGDEVEGQSARRSLHEIYSSRSRCQGTLFVMRFKLGDDSGMWGSI